MESDPGLKKSVLKRVLLEVVEENLRLGKKLATYRFIFVKARDGGGLVEAWRWRPDLLRLQFAFQSRSQLCLKKI